MTSERGKSALHVEDSTLFHLEICKPFLESNGYATIENATNLEDALSAIRRRPYDLYVVDGIFPRNSQSGPEYLWLEFHEALTQQYTNPRVILLTMDDRLQRIAEERGITYLDKADPDLRQKLR